MKTLRLSIAAFCLLAASPMAVAQSTSFDIELGYQWVDVDGDENLYRTQINQQDGFVLRGFSLNHTDASGDASIADALVNLANKGYLIEGQGNFGNLFTGDPAAASQPHTGRPSGARPTSRAIAACGAGRMENSRCPRRR